MQAFRERALDEARRYGSDPWVFVRELLQNARDAGARRVDFGVAHDRGRVHVVCRDDGHGLTLDHARRYLFRLYSSSKDGRRGEAGRFGVGFWSVLLFEPAALRVRSWPPGGEAWEAVFDGALNGGEAPPPPPERPGTEVRLERPGDASAARAVAAAIADAARRHARFLTRLGAIDHPLDVRVDGVPSTEPFDLPAPRVAFRRRGLRGVVGLGPVGRVELHARGLRVRSAATLDDLLALERAGDAAAPPPAPRGLAPVVLLDSHQVELPLTRDDARATPALGRLVRAARRELDRLLAEQVECLRPRPGWRRALDALRARRRGLTMVALAALAFTLGAALAGSRAGSPGAPAAAAPAPPLDAAFDPGAPPPPTGPETGALTGDGPPIQPHRELGLLYRGPKSDHRAPSARYALRYTPPEAQPLLAALWLLDPHDAPGPPRDAGPYPPGDETPRGESLEVTLAVRSAGGLVRLPVPTGLRVQGASVRVDGRVATPRAGAVGEPLVRLPAGDFLVRYSSSPGPVDRRGWRVELPLVLPEAIGWAAHEIGQRPRARIVPEATAWVARRVRYSQSAATRDAHARLAHLSPVPRALAVGAGDCDVQNGVLALLLRASGVPARLAVGYVGTHGEAREGLHAWVEYVDDGAWRATDASQVDDEGAARDRATLAGLPPDTFGLGPPADAAASPLAPGSSPALGRGGTAVLAFGLAGALAAAAVAALALRRRATRDMHLDPRQDLARLLRAVLQEPQAFAHLPHLSSRPLLPCLSGRALSLDEARALAAEGRLGVARGPGDLARRAARAGLRVLDRRRDEAAAAADALGAIDLDQWATRLSACRSSPLLDAVARRFAARGGRWRLAVLDGVGELAVLDLRPRGFFPRDGLRVALLDPGVAWLRQAEADHARWPEVACLAVAERLTRRLGLGDAERLELLGPLARAALDEAAP